MVEKLTEDLDKLDVKNIDNDKQNIKNCGKDGHWLEKKKGIKHNTKNEPYINGSEMVEKLTEDLDKLDVKLSEEEEFIKKINTDFEFYKESLRKAETEIKTIHETEKALKDVVGKAYETHRKRVWQHFGFDVTKHRHDAQFSVDWAIEYDGKLIALEEDKGHYADSCMHLRAFSEFAKTINNYNKKNKEIPVLILCSFTRYSKHEEKFEELKETWKTEIIMHINKMHYTTLTYCDRINKKHWVGNKQSTRTDSYSYFAEDALILKDIEFIKSLIPVSE